GGVGDTTHRLGAAAAGDASTSSATTAAPTLRRTSCTTPLPRTLIRPDDHTPSSCCLLQVAPAKARCAPGGYRGTGSDARSRSSAESTARALRRTSSSLVLWFDTEMRMAVTPCQSVPPNQAT